MSGAPVIENLAEARRSGRNLAAQCIAILCQPDELGVPALGPGLSTSAATTNGMPVQRAAAASGGELSVPGTLDVVEFLTRRLEQALAEEGRPIEHIRAALVRTERPARIKAILTQLAALAGTPDFDRLVQTMQRARRIVPPAPPPTTTPPSSTQPPTTTSPPSTHAVAEFFDQVYVMDHNPQRRAARLGLLAAIGELGELGEHTLAWSTCIPEPHPTTSAVVGGEAVAPAVAVAPVSGPRADGSGAEQSEPTPEIRAGC